jgi:hypothetical protein
MNKESKNLASDLQKCDCNVTAVLAEQMSSDCVEQDLENVSVVEFGSIYFVAGTVDSAPIYSFLPTGKEHGVSEDQFDAIAAMLKQFPFAFYYGEGRLGPAEFVSFKGDNVYLNVAGFLVSKGILRKKWLKRHKKFLMENTKNPDEPAQWDVISGDGFSLREHYSDGILEYFTLLPLVIDPFEEIDRLDALHTRFCEIAKHAKYIFFPYSAKMEKVEDDNDLIAQFFHSVDEASLSHFIFTSIGNVQ